MNSSQPQTIKTWGSRFAMALIHVPLLVIAVGCSPKDKPSVEILDRPVVVPEPLTMLVIDDEGLGQRIARQWSARRDGKLTIVNRQAEEFAASGFEIGNDVDIVVYPPGMMGELMSRDRLVPLPKDVWNSDDINKVELLRHYRVTIARRANESWAVPLGGPNFSMLCNLEVFAAIDAAPPTTWEELDRILKKTNARKESNQKPFSEHPDLSPQVDMPLAKGWAAKTFLARVAPAVCHRGKLSIVFDRRTLEPLIASAPFVEALEQLKSIASERSLDLKPTDVFALATAGDSSIAFGWPALAFSNETENEKATENGGDLSNKDVISIHSLPGINRWYDHQNSNWIKRSEADEPQIDLIGFSGLVASVSTTSRKQATAFKLLQWLPSKSISLLTLVESPTLGPFRASHLGDASRWTGDAISADLADQYAEVIASNHERSMFMMFPRVPGQQEYLAALDDGVRNVMSGSQSAQAALDEVAETWQAITERLGREAQAKEFKKESGF